MMQIKQATRLIFCLHILLTKDLLQWPLKFLNDNYASTVIHNFKKFNFGRIAKKFTAILFSDQYANML